MKRYNPHAKADGCVMAPDESGEWVKWEDVDTLTPGSPAYVRALRDRAAVEFFAAIAPGDVGFTFDAAVSMANDQVRALGYEPPGEAK